MVEKNFLNLAFYLKKTLAILHLTLSDSHSYSHHSPGFYVAFEYEKMAAKHFRSKFKVNINLAFELSNQEIHNAGCHIIRMDGSDESVE